jgi:isoquinoline 1-oxidoreductase beta subunit
MGQGVLSGLAQIVAEELKVDWARVQSKHAPAEPIFANPVYHAQLTGGSASVRGYYTALRQVGAGAKAMLIQAAATAFEVSPSACVAASGKVIGPKAGQVMTYGQLATAAAQLTPPSNPPLTDPSKFVLIGTAVPRPDIPVKTTGAAVYGIDVRIPGMVYAAIKHCPTLGGTVAATPATPAGTFGVVNLGDAVAVLADSTYGAMRAASAITVSWNVPNGSSSVSDERISARAAQLLAGGPAVVAEAIGGDVTKALAGAVHSVDATYNLPYVPHACMEVLNCTVSVTPTSCEIWAPTQSQGPVAAIAASLTHLAASQVTVHTTFLGGGLGRKGETDFVVQAIKIAQVVGKPVHLTWSREEDFAHDFYRPMARIRVRAGLAADGSLVAWNNRIVSPSILAQKGWIPVGSVDSQAFEGAVGPAFPYPGHQQAGRLRPPPVTGTGQLLALGRQFPQLLLGGERHR